jgi:hypothetical protein
MPTRLSIHQHLAVHDLERRDRGAKAPGARRHGHILWLLAQGRASAPGAAVTGYRVNGIRTLARRSNQRGPMGRGDRRPHNPGATGRLAAAQRTALAVARASPPGDGGVGTGPQVATWMAAPRGRPGPPQRGWEAFRRLGWPPQRPRPRHAKADPAAPTAVKKSARPSCRPGRQRLHTTMWSSGPPPSPAWGASPSCDGCGVAQANARPPSSSLAPKGAISPPADLCPRAARSGYCCPRSPARLSPSP